MIVRKRAPPDTGNAPAPTSRILGSQQRISGSVKNRDDGAPGGGLQVRVLETMHIQHSSGPRKIELLLGDLSAIPDEHAVDTLIVSAFPGSYEPLPHTLIGALDRRGLSVQELSEHKEIDLRRFSNCWLSQPISDKTLNFRHLLCFEPFYSGHQSPASVVGDVFRSLVPFTSGEPWINSVAMPLVAAGDQRAAPLEMLDAILEQAVRWLSAGLSLDTLKIVLFDGLPPETVKAAEHLVRERTRALAGPQHEDFRPTRHDLFISYSHKDAQAVLDLVSRIKAVDPEVRLFFDQQSLRTGDDWQQGIFEAIGTSRKVVCLLSPDYLTSKVCIEEYNVAHMRNREEGDVLIPVYLRSAELPHHMRLVQYIDVRENDPERLASLATQVCTLGTRPAGSAPPARAPAEKTPSAQDGPAATVVDASVRDIVDAVVGDDEEITLEVTVRRLRRR